MLFYAFIIFFVLKENIMIESCEYLVGDFECVARKTVTEKAPARALASSSGDCSLCGFAIRENNFGIPTSQEDISNCLQPNNSTQ